MLQRCTLSSQATLATQANRGYDFTMIIFDTQDAVDHPMTAYFRPLIAPTLEPFGRQPTASIADLNVLV
jgi:hypothetical protein